MFHIFAFILTFCREQYISYRWSKLFLLQRTKEEKKEMPLFLFFQDFLLLIILSGGKVNLKF